MNQESPLVNERGASKQRLGKYYKRSEARQAAFDYIQALLSPVERKNGWQMSEQVGYNNPYRFQNLLGRASWDDYDVPMLIPQFQATGLELPLDMWGTKPKKRFLTKTFGFYQVDYKFTQLFSDPMKLCILYPKAAIEVNCSTDLNTPLSYLLGVIYAKRWLSRMWQSECAIKIWVDMNWAAEQAQW